MANTPNTFTTLSAQFIETYGDTVEKLYPDSAWLSKNIPFEKQNGATYHQPMLLSYEQGVTYSKPANGAFSLEDSVPAVIGDAQVTPSQLVLTSTVDYEAAYRSAGAGKLAFFDATKLVVMNMVDSLTKRAEIDFIYGRQSIGAVNAATSSVTTFVISDATWAPAIWAGLETAHVAILNSDLAAAEDTDEAISSVDLDTKTITVGNAQSLDAGDLVYFKGAVAAGSPATHHSMVSIDTITGTSSGTLFNINVGTYALARGQSSASQGQPTMKKIMALVTKAVNRGCQEELVVLAPPRMYEELNTDLAAARRLDGSYSRAKAEAGSENITFYGQNGAVRIVPHIYVKEGDCFVLPIKRMKRLGSTEITFKRPVHGDIFKESTGIAGFELRAYTAQAIFCDRPGYMVRGTGFTYA